MNRFYKNIKVCFREEYKAMESDHLGLSMALGIPVGVVKVKLSQGGFIPINEEDSLTEESQLNSLF